MNWRAGARRLLPYAIAATGGFLLAYLIVAFVVFPSEIVPSDETVPNVVGMELDAATQRLQAAGFRPVQGEARVHISAPQNQVLEQTPPAGSREVRGTRVVLAISGGQQRAAVPTLAGMTRLEAVEALRGAGFTLGLINQRASNLPRGQVIDSDPPGGTRTLIPSSVSVVISAGPAAVQVPDMVGQPYGQVRTLLEQLGLRVGVVDIDRFSSEVANTVIAQSPQGGETIAAGGRIQLTISGRTP
ncbi:MAG TPA: PASTA domain-containing protein [Gemmatimonadaceae bacterium]|nr:PASTA domain-containing protein [Gemmatimonadaceae bacterium]